jgi:hypothetical protein
MPLHSLSVGDAMLRAHETLHEDLDRLHEALASVAAAGHWLTALRGHVIDHFRQEEQGGYMAAVLERQPHKERVVQQLLAEHARLAEALDALLAEVASAESLDDGLRGRVGAWAEHLRRHEAEENVLVEDAFNRDVGPTD